MAQTIKLKRSNTADAQPTTAQLASGELALNTRDGKIYMRKYIDGSNDNDLIVQISGSGADRDNVVDTFTSNGSTDEFTLSITPASEANTAIYLDGVYQNKTSYTLSGTTLAFGNGNEPPSGTVVEVIIFSNQISAVNPLSELNVAGNSILGTEAGATATGTAIKDEDNMSSNSASHLATQQSIKAYVDAQVATEDTLAELNDTNITSPADASVLLYDTGTSTWRDAAMSGDVTITDTGVTTVANDSHTHVYTNLTGTVPTWNQATTGNAATVTTNANLTGDVTSVGNATSIAAGVIINADVKSDAAIAYSKLGTIPTWNQATTGLAATATILATARTIGGVSFNGSANINLPGVNAAGNQATSGLAATATVLATARTIGGVSFNGSANINLPGVNAAGNQNTSGTAANLSGSPNITVGTIGSGNITTTGYLRGPASFTIDPATHGDDTGTVVIAGNLQVDGTTTTINSTTVSIDDLNFSIATDAANSAAANGAGITIGGAGATLLYTHATTSWDMNKPLNVTGTLGVSGVTTLASHLVLGDDDEIRLGASTDITLKHHNSGYGHLQNTGTLYVDAEVLSFRTDNSSIGERLNINAAGLAAFSGAATIAGTLGVTGSTHFQDSINIDGNATLDGSTGITFDSSGTQRIYKNGKRVLEMPDSASADLILGEGYTGYVWLDSKVKVNGALDVTGVISPTTHIDMPDDAKIQLGTGDDLLLYHSSNNSYIETTPSSAGDFYIHAKGTNHDLYLRADDDIYIQPQTNENGITVAGNGAVTLYYDANPKLATVTGGINVTGDTDTDTLTVSGNGTVGGTLGVTGELTGKGATFSPNTAGKGTFNFTTNASNDGRLLIKSDTTVKVDIQANGDTYFNGGDVGIGTTSPGTRLDILTVANTAGVRVTAPNTTGQSFGTTIAAGTNSSDYAFNVNNAAGAILLKIRGDGNVGIGTASPGYPIHVESSVAGDWMGKIKNTHATNGYGLLIHAGDDASVKALSVGNYAGAGDYLVVRGDGNVGIGTDAPAEMLNLESTSASPAILVKAASQNSSTSPTAELILSPGSLSSNDSACKVIGYRIGDYSSAGVRTSGLKFQTTNANAAVTAMTIDNSGNVGIGTTSPNVGGGTGLHIHNSSSPRVHFTNDTTGTAATDGTELLVSGADFYIDQQENGKIIFYQNGSQTALFGTNRGLSIGTTTTTGSGGLLVDNDIKTNSRYGVGSTGSVGAPAIYLNSDTDTGVYWPSANALGLVTGGVSRLHLDSSGNVTFSGDITMASSAQINASSAFYLDSDIIHFRANNETERMRIQSSGVGIGTTAPATDLQIGDYTDNAETITIATASDQTGRINFYNANASEGASMRVTGGGLGAKMHFANRYTTDTDRVTFDLVNGRVGIGTTSPAGILHVDGHTGSVATILEANGNGDQVPLWFRVKANNADVTNHGIFGNAGSAGADNTIHIGPSASSTGLTVASDGNVGIGYGTTAPATPLQVKKGSDGSIIRISRHGICDWDISIGNTPIGANGSSGDLEIIPQNANMGFAVVRAGQSGINMRVRDGVMTVGSGIKFNSDTADANMLDDYEEGLWTPSIAADAGPGGYTYQTGYFTKIGRKVHVTGQLRISSMGSFSGGTVNVGSLPFTIVNLTNYDPRGVLGLKSAATAKTDIFVRGVANTTYMRLENLNGNTLSDRNMNANAIDTDTIVFVDLTYFTA